MENTNINSELLSWLHDIHKEKERLFLLRTEGRIDQSILLKEIDDLKVIEKAVEDRLRLIGDGL